MSFAVLALIAFVGGGQPVDTPPDYTGTMRYAYGAPPAIILSHAGATRMDFSRHNGEIEAEYDAPGRRSLVITVKNPAGEITTLWIRRPDKRRSLSETDWQDTGKSRELAGETCRMQQVAGSNFITDQRCMTPDGVNLLPVREGRLMEMQTLVRGAVRADDVTPPMPLLDLRRWAPAEALIEKPGRVVEGDYVATFARSARTVRRSGDWTSTTEAGAQPSTTLVNDALGLEVRLSGPAHEDLWIRRFTSGRRFGPFTFKPALMKGKAEDVVLGQSCRWQARSSSPDSNTLECWTVDGAVLAIGFNGMGDENWEPATSFRREPVPLASVLPAAELFSPARYGLTPSPPEN